MKTLVSASLVAVLGLSVACSSSEDGDDQSTGVAGAGGGAAGAGAKAGQAGMGTTAGGAAGKAGASGAASGSGGTAGKAGAGGAGKGGTGGAGASGNGGAGSAGKSGTSGAGGGGASGKAGAGGSSGKGGGAAGGGTAGTAGGAAGGGNGKGGTAGAGGNAGTAGVGGNAGAGSSGKGGTGGVAGGAGQGGNGGEAGAAGTGGDAGSAGEGGNGGNAGSAGQAGATGAGCGWGGPADGTAKVIATLTLPPTSLKSIDPLLTDEDLASALANGAGTTDDPGMGSGLDYLGGCDFGWVTDRGPNGDRPDGAKFFPMPAFTPTIATVTSSGGVLSSTSVLPILDTAGNPVTGLSNDANDDLPYPTATATEPLAYVQSGLDPEDIHRLPSGDWILVEEYSPSVAIVDGASGKVKVRYVPEGVSLPSAGYPVKAILPGILTSRRPNKGLEGLAVSPDGTTAYVVVQTALGDEAKTGKSLVNRVVRIDDVGNPDGAHVGAHWIALHSPSTAYPGTKQTKVYFNAAAWLGTDRVLLLERGEGLMRLFAADVSNATNLVGHPELGESNLDPEAVTSPPGYQTLGIVPATMTEVFTSADTPEILVSPPAGSVAPGKLEGLTVLDETTVAIANDNDFGIVDPKDASRIWILRLKAALP